MIKIKAHDVGKKIFLNISVKGSKEEIAAQAAAIVIKLPEELMEHGMDVFDLFQDCVKKMIDKECEELAEKLTEVMNDEVES